MMTERTHYESHTWDDEACIMCKVTWTDCSDICAQHEHLWNLGSGWALWLEHDRHRTSWWFRDCAICHRSEWRRELPTT